jgi:hypothetical protein
MRRPLRILFNAATVVSLALCMATVAMHIRSHWFHDNIHWGAGQWLVGTEHHCRDLFFDSSEGRLYVWGVGAKSTGGPFRNVPPAGWQYRREPINSANPPRWYGDDRRTLGIAFVNEFRSSGHHVVMVGVPGWQVALMTAVLPVVWWWVRRRRRLRAKRAGLCGSCGYDLHGNESGVCPECGTPAVMVNA